MIKVKKLLTVLSFVFLLFSLMGCVNNKTNDSKSKIETEVPTLKVSYADKSIQGNRGTYSWTIDNKDGTKSSVIADSSGPSELVKNTTPLEVPPKAAITLSFSSEPKSITVNIWKEDKIIEQERSNNKVIVPETAGTVIYEVIGTWEQGTVHYAFMVDVK